MKVNVTSSKGLESKLSVTVTKKEIQNKIDVKLDEVKNTINWKPKTSFDKGLKKTISSYRYASE